MIINEYVRKVCKYIVSSKVSKVTGYSSLQHASPPQKLMCHMGS